MSSVEEIPSRSSSVRVLQEAEQKIIHIVEVAAEVMEELGKLGKADQGAAAKLCTTFLDEVKEVHSTLGAAIDAKTPYSAVENADYAAKLEASINLQKLEVVIAQLKGWGAGGGAQAPQGA